MAFQRSVPLVNTICCAINTKSWTALDLVKSWCETNIEEPSNQVIIKSKFIYCCIKHDELDILKYIINQGYTKKMLRYSDISLHHAILQNNFEMVEYLISLDDTLIYETNKDSQTSLLCALLEFTSNRYGYKKKHHIDIDIRIKIIKYIIESDVTNDILYIADEVGLLPIHYAAREKYNDIITFIVNRVSSSPEIQKGLMLTDGQNLEKQMILSMIDHEDCKQSTPMHFAAYNGNIDGVSLLLELGSQSARKYNSEKYLPIHLAIVAGNTEIVKLFIKSDNSLIDRLDEQDLDGNTLMHKIIYSRNMIQLLVRLGSKSLSMQNNKHLIPLETTLRELYRSFEYYLDFIKMMVILGNNYDIYTKYCNEYYLYRYNIKETEDIDSYENTVKKSQGIHFLNKCVITETYILDINYETFFAHSLVFQLLLFI